MFERRHCAWDGHKPQKGSHWLAVGDAVEPPLRLQPAWCAVHDMHLKRGHAVSEFRPRLVASRVRDALSPH